MEMRRFTAYLALSLGLSVIGAQNADAQETFGSVDSRIPGTPKEAFVPYSIRSGFEGSERIPELVLGSIDIERLVLEDLADAASGSKVLRYGLGRDLYADLGYGEWFTLDDGSVLWALDLVSTGALGMRALFSNLQLPAGAELYVFARPSSTSSRTLAEIVAGPYTNETEAFGSDLWTPTRDGERLRVEMRVPSESAGDVGAPFTLKGVQHIYRDPLKGLGGPAGAGPCHNDVTCFPAYATPRDAVAGIGTVNTNSLWCTGQLLDAQNGDLTPYWLTANHCLSTQSEASSAEIYWLYQSSTCNGSVPSLSSVPQSANCSVLATNPGSDFTLLMVNGELPTGLSWAGWTSSTVANGTVSGCVHHPSGDFKRISFGTKAVDSPGFVRINWTDGPTEPGSSGSGVFRDDTKQLFGQLQGGPSSCGNESNDSYGAFATTYSSISGLLTAGSDDLFEPNDACVSAALLSTSNNSNLVVKSGDEDWYQFTLNNGGSVNATFTFTDAHGDIDVRLHQGCGGPTVASSETGTNNEAISFTNNTGSPQTYFMRVWLFSDTRNEYGMNATITGGGPTGPANDDCSSAIAIGNGSFSGTLIGATNDGSAVCGNSNSNGDVWYSYTASCTGTFEVDTCGTNDIGGVDQGTDTVLSLHSACPGTSGNQILCNDDFAAGECSDAGDTRDSALSMPVVAGQTVLIRVSHWNTSTPKIFNLNTSCTGVAGVPGDSCASPIALSSSFAVTAYDATGATTDGQALDGFCDYGDFGDEQCHNDIWFTYTPNVGGCTYISTLGLAGYDTRLAVYNSTACQPAQSSVLACVDDEEIPTATPFEAGLDVTLTAGQTYMIRLGTYSAGTAAGAGSIRIAPGPVADGNNGGANVGAPGCTIDSPFAEFCHGDGGDQAGCTNCPCGNNAPAGTQGGCRNSAGTSAQLIASGDTSVSLPFAVDTDLRFGLTGAPAGAFCILNSGNGVAPTNAANPCFGLNSGAQAMQFDGLRCAVVNTRRHGGRPADANGDVGVTNNGWGTPSGPPIGLVAQGGYTAGQTRNYQLIYREDPLLSCQRALNTSQAVSMTFVP